MAKTVCNAVGCQEPRVRPASATHCKTHEVEWFAVQRDQREILRRRRALGMTEIPRSWRDPPPR